MEILNISEHLGHFQLPEDVWKPLIPFLYEIREEDPESDVRSNFGGWQKNGIQDCDELFEFKQNLIDRIDQYVHWLHEQYYVPVVERQDPKWAISIDNVFVNINPKGSYHVMHSHTGCNYSGVFYLQSDTGTSGGLHIQHPFKSPWMGEMQGRTTKDLYTVIEPEPGTGIIFPAYLLHHVGPNMSEDDRIAISFNFTVHFNEHVSDLLQELEKSRK